MSGAGGSASGGPTRPDRPRGASRRTDATPPRPADALATLGALAGDLAHEIRNPLVALASFLDLLGEPGHDPDAMRGFLEVARDELRRAERLLDAMVDARGGGGRPDRPGEAASAVRAVAMLLGPRARSRGVRIEVRVAPDLPALALGADALRQVVLNLALNAVDASPAQARIEIAAHATTDGVEISVADAGAGLRPGERAARRPGGRGLAITRRLLAAAGGSLTTRRAPGGGTLARVCVPALKRTA